MPDAVRHAVGHRGHHHAAVGVADWGHACEFLCRAEVSDVSMIHSGLPRVVMPCQVESQCRLCAAYVFRTSHMIGTGAFTTPDRLVRVAW